MNIKSTPIYAESWNVAYRTKAIGEIFTDKQTEFRIIPNSSKYWAADPMAFEYKGKVYIFAELYDYRLSRGTIGYTLYNGKEFDTWKQILVEEYHMSYPNIFCVGDDVFMLPETSSANQLILYRAIDFPEKWEKAKVIADDVKWVDTTLYWLRNNIIGYTEQLSNPRIDLMLSLDNELNLQKRIIVSEGCDTMRCGGRCFEYENKIVRVCQDCHEKYGGALIFRFCDNVSLTEQYHLTIKPDELSFNKKILLDGMHTYTALHDFEVIDIKTRRFNLCNFAHRIKKRIMSKIKMFRKR